MFDTLGRRGLLGLVFLLVGIGLVAFESLVVAAGIAFVVLGLALVVQGLIAGFQRRMAMF